MRPEGQLSAAAGTRFDAKGFPPPGETQTSKALDFTPSREARFWRELAATAAAERLVGLSRDRDRRFSLSPAALAAIEAPVWEFKSQASGPTQRS